jgi:L-malate glycosyltransferase
VIRDGLDGFVIPIRDSSAIADALGKFLTHPDMLRAMSQAAREHAEEELSLQAYQIRLVTTILETCSA